MTESACHSTCQGHPCSTRAAYRGAAPEPFAPLGVNDALRKRMAQLGELTRQRKAARSGRNGPRQRRIRLDPPPEAYGQLPLFESPSSEG